MATKPVRVRKERDVPGSIYCSSLWKTDVSYIRYMKHRKTWVKIKTLYRLIRHIKYVSKCVFTPLKQAIVTPIYEKDLLEAINDGSIAKEDVKNQIIELVIALNKAGVAHRDMHIGNFVYNRGRIYLIDLEFLEEDKRPLKDCYDLTGKGLDSPLESAGMHIFSNHTKAVSSHIDLSMSDFLGVL